MKVQSYRINLNKASNRLDQFENTRKRRKIVAMGFFFLLILLGTGFVLYKANKVNNLIEGQRAELQSIEDKIAQLEASSDYLSPEDIFTLAHMTQSRLNWSHKLASLGEILPKDVVITELKYDESMRVFTIKGVSKVRLDIKDLDLVVSIIDLLKAQPEFVKDFNEIKFQSSQRIRHDNQEIVKFEIACLLKA
jgi:Tfp pilus assembly protein PilN